MRFRIEDRRWRPNTPYRLHAAGRIVEITRPVVPTSFNQGELQWNWPDDCRYTLKYPMLRKGKPPTWQVCCGDDVISVGRWAALPARRAFLRVKGPPVEWESDGVVVRSDEVGCCGGVVHRDARLLSMWTRRVRHWEGVWRNSLRENEVPVIIAVILASLHDD